jgi:hypothetical protein
MGDRESRYKLRARLGLGVLRVVVDIVATEEMLRRKGYLPPLSEGTRDELEAATTLWLADVVTHDLGDEEKVP